MRGPALNEALPEPMVAMFVRDLTEGIAGTGVRAAFLKCAIDVPGMTPGVERMLRAVAQAHRETGAPVMATPHRVAGPGWRYTGCCASEGVDPRHVLLAHSGDSADADHLSDLADAATCWAWTGSGSTGDRRSRRGRHVAELAARGYAERMVLSHDAACYIDWIDPNVLPFLPQWHYLRASMTEAFCRMPRARGDDEISPPCRRPNPRRFRGPAIRDASPLPDEVRGA